jgi:hypothetical protein
VRITEPEFAARVDGVSVHELTCRAQSLPRLHGPLLGGPRREVLLDAGGSGGEVVDPNRAGREHRRL